MKKTDNSHFVEKVRLRQEAVDIAGKDEIKVLECYAGKGRLWQKLKKDNPEKRIHVLQIEKEKGKNPTALEGDNMKYLPSLNLEDFDIIDLDAYGIPAKQIVHLHERRYRGIVIVTAIQSVMGILPSEVLYANGYTPAMLARVKTLFNIDGTKKLQNFLYICGVKRIKGFFIGNERKNYFLFKFSY